MFYCGNGEKIQMKFCSNNNGKIEGIEISHGNYKIGDRIRYFKEPYPKNIPKWDKLTMLLKKLEIKITENNKRLKIKFPSVSSQNGSNIVCFKELLQTHSAKSLSKEGDSFL